MPTYSINGHPFSKVTDAGSSVIFSRGAEAVSVGLMVGANNSPNADKVEAIIYLPDAKRSFVSVPIPAEMRLEGICAANDRAAYIHSAARRARSIRGYPAGFYYGGKDEQLSDFVKSIDRENVMLEFPINGASAYLNKPVGVQGTYMAIGRWDSRVCYMAGNPGSCDTIHYDRGEIIPSKVFAACKIRVDRRKSKHIIELARAALTEKAAMNVCGIVDFDFNAEIVSRWKEKVGDMSLANCCRDEAIALAIMVSSWSSGYSITGCSNVASLICQGLGNISTWTVESGETNPYSYNTREKTLDILFKRGIVTDEYGMHEMLYDGTV